MTTTKTNFQSFTQYWNQRKSWAQSNGISPSAVDAVYKLDQQKMAGGSTPMTNLQAVNAMQAANSGHTVTGFANVSGSVNPINVASNATKDALSIGAGITKLPSTLLSAGEELIGKGPGAHGLGVALGDLFHGNIKGFLDTASTNPLLGLIPGIQTADGIMNHGLSYLAEHPLFSLLDVAGAMDIAGGLLAKGGEEASAIGKIGGLSAEDTVATLSRVGKMSDTLKAVHDTASDVLSTDPKHPEFQNKLNAFNNARDHAVSSNAFPELAKFGEKLSLPSNMLSPFHLAKEAGNIIGRFKVNSYIERDPMTHEPILDAKGKPIRSKVAIGDLARIGIAKSMQALQHDPLSQLIIHKISYINSDKRMVQWKRTYQPQLKAISDLIPSSDTRAMLANAFTFTKSDIENELRFNTDLSEPQITAALNLVDIAHGIRDEMVKRNILVPDQYAGTTFYYPASSEYIKLRDRSSQKILTQEGRSAQSLSARMTAIKGMIDATSNRAGSVEAENLIAVVEQLRSQTPNDAATHFANKPYLTVARRYDPQTKKYSTEVVPATTTVNKSTPIDENIAQIDAQVSNLRTQVEPELIQMARDLYNRIAGRYPIITKDNKEGLRTPNLLDKTYKKYGKDNPTSEFGDAIHPEAKSSKETPLSTRKRIDGVLQPITVQHSRITIDSLRKAIAESLQTGKPIYDIPANEVAALNEIFTELEKYLPPDKTRILLTKEGMSAFRNEVISNIRKDISEQVKAARKSMPTKTVESSTVGLSSIETKTIKNKGEDPQEISYVQPSLLALHQNILNDTANSPFVLLRNSLVKWDQLAKDLRTWSRSFYGADDRSLDTVISDGEALAEKYKTSDLVEMYKKITTDMNDTMKLINKTNSRMSDIVNNPNAIYYAHINDLKAASDRIRFLYGKSNHEGNDTGGFSSMMGRMPNSLDKSLIAYNKQLEKVQALKDLITEKRKSSPPDSFKPMLDALQGWNMLQFVQDAFGLGQTPLTLAGEKIVGGKFSAEKFLSDTLDINPTEMARIHKIESVEQGLSRTTRLQEIQVHILEAVKEADTTYQDMLKNAPDKIAQMRKYFNDRANREFDKQQRKFVPTEVQTPLYQPQKMEFTQEDYKNFINLQLTKAIPFAMRQEYFSLMWDTYAAKDFTTLQSQFGSIVGKVLPKIQSEFKEDAMKTWTQLADMGYEPVFMHTVTASDIKKSATAKNFVSDKRKALSAEKQRSFSLSDSVRDPILAVTGEVLEYLQRQGNEEFVQFLQDSNILRSREQVELDARIKQRDLIISNKNIKSLGSATSMGHDLNKVILDNYSVFNPGQFLQGRTLRSVLPQYSQKDVLYIPKQVEKVINDSFKTAESHIWKRVIDPITSLFKTSILSFSPRFVAHIALGGTTMAVMRLGVGYLPELFRSMKILKPTYSAIRSGAKDLHYEIDFRYPTHSAEQGGEYDIALAHLGDNPAESLLHASIGQKMGQLTADIMYKKIGLNPEAMSKVERVVNFPRAFKDFNEWMISAQHLAIELMAKKKNLTVDDSVKLAEKVFADLNGMTPFERSVVKRIIPFYAFQKHIMRYIMQYPLDHPLRMAVMASAADVQNQKLEQSGLPLTMDYLFSFGSHQIDLRQINPFRTSGNYFTLTGFIQGINPLAQGLLTSMGVNTMNAAPELYPQLTYDPFFATQTAARTDTIYNMIQSIVPQFALVDHFAQLTQYTKQLARSNPRSYRQQLYQALNFPWMPQSNYTDALMAKSEIARLKQAQADISQALVTGNFDTLKRYVDGSIPYQAQTVTVSNLQQIYNAAKAQAASVNMPNGLTPNAKELIRPTGRRIIV